MNYFYSREADLFSLQDFERFVEMSNEFWDVVERVKRHKPVTEMI